MSSRQRTPLLALESYVQIPRQNTSLFLLTSTLGCTVNWLVSQFIGAAFDRPQRLTQQDESVADGQEACVVLLASWLRDLTFWKQEIRRTSGVDVTKSIQNKTFVFLDLLSQQTLDATAQNRLITASITQLQQANPDSRIILILDNPDVLLATASTTTTALNTSILTLRSLAHTTILTAAADLPLISAAAPSDSIHAGQPTPLEVDCASFIASQAHNARVVMSARELATGAAKDISGVLRATRGGDAFDIDAESTTEIREAELQYLVQRDGIVKVFSRGADIN